MMNAELHLVDSKGLPVSPLVRSAVETAYRWVRRDFPRIDPAMIANWAEQVSMAMHDRESTLGAPGRYAYAALKGKVRDWMRTRPAQEEAIGVGRDLERVGGVGGSFQAVVDRKILFEQLKASLNERDRCILVLLLQDQTSPTIVAASLGVSYSAAAKAIQRVKDRIALTLAAHRSKMDDPHICETKG